MMTKIVTCAAPIAAALFKTGLKSLFKRAAIFSVTILALIEMSSPLRAAEAAPNPAGFDILGMKLGMSVEEIQAAIRAYNPSLTITVSKVALNQRFGVGKFLQFVLAQRQPPGEFPEDIVVGFTVTQPGRAFYIRRHTTFPREQQPLRDNTVQQLREKYGPETASMGAGNSGLIDFGWLFDKANKQEANKGPTTRLGCGEEVSYGQPQFFIAPVLAPGNYSSQCGIELRVNLQPSTNTNVLLGLLEQLVGDSIAADDIQKLMAEAKAVQEQQRQQQEQKASGVKAPL